MPFDEARILSICHLLLFNVVRRICSDTPIIQSGMQQMNQVAKMPERFDEPACRSMSDYEHHETRKTDNNVKHYQEGVHTVRV
jgi:hypothetical protein